MAPDQLSEYVLNAMRVLCVYAIVYFIAFALEAPTVFWVENLPYPNLRYFGS